MNNQLPTLGFAPKVFKLAALVFTFLIHAQVHALSIVDGSLEELADQARITLTFDQNFDGKLGLFRISNPARQVVDFPVELGNSTLPIDLPPGGRIKKTQLIAAGGKTRLVLELAQNYEVRLNQKDRSVELIFSGPKPFRPDGGQAAILPEHSALKDTVAKAMGRPAVIAEGPILKAWKLEKSANRHVLRLEFDRPEIVADAVLLNNQLKVRFANVRLAAGVKQQLQTDEDSPIKQLELKPGDLALTVQMQLDGATHLIRQSGPVVEVEVNRVSSSVVSGKAIEIKPASSDQSLVARYIGRPITLDFKDADIRTVMQVFADFTKMNLVLSDSVQGKVTVFLKDVPWDQALDIVMRSKGLVSSQSGNVLLVSTPTDVNNDQFQSANRRAQDEMEPLVSKVFQVSYQKTADLVTLIKSEDSKLLSARGTLISDERTSQIFVQDTPTRLERISMIVNGLDKPVKQVMIEARVVLADTSVSRDLGIRLRALSSRADPGFKDVGDQFGSGNFLNTGVENGANLGYTLFNANSTRLINLQLRALELENKVRTVSNPRVITSNKEPALIEQGTEIPYQIATSSGATATEFKEANLKLAVTPQIAPDGTVLLDVDVAKDSIGIETSNGPAIDTRRVKTKVLVSDGGTVVLGGIFEEDDNVLNDKTPFLGDIPGLGVLFRGKNESKRRAELLIFLTPVVLTSQ
jgi:type IV pilus assembly protein PilQ